MLCHSNACVRDVLTAPSNVYLNLGLNLFHSYNTLQDWDPPTFRGFFGLIFPTKRTFEPTVLLLKKAARCHPFLAVVRCLFHNHLRLKRSSLLNVYLNCKFEISLLTFHLFFSLLKLKSKHTILLDKHLASEKL